MTPFTPFSLNIRGRLRTFPQPVVMAILNITTDSFYAASRTAPDDLGRRALYMLENRAEMLDLGAYSTRPGAISVPAELECERIVQGVAAVRKAVGDDVIISVDTFRASVAREAFAAGADIINDISGGTLDDGMFDTVAELRTPYILMHTRGTPATMQSMTDYEDVVADVIADLSRKIGVLEEKGVADVIVDPGFGFAKTLEQNYRMLGLLERFALLGKPLLAGMSRKSMFTKLLGITADEALVPTAIAGVLALERGAAILRVHDPREAAQSIRIINEIKHACLCSASV